MCGIFGISIKREKAMPRERLQQLLKRLFLLSETWNAGNRPVIAGHYSPVKRGECMMQHAIKLLLLLLSFTMLAV